MEGGNGTPLAGKIVVSAVFDGGAAIENGRLFCLISDHFVEFK